MIAVFVTALAVSAIGMFFVLPLLKRAQVLDVPNARSSHVTPTPRGGGVAVIMAVLLASLLASAQGRALPAIPLLAIVAYAALGLADDFRSLDVKIRLVVQLAVAAGVAAVVLGADSGASVVAVALATVWLVGYTNAFNFMDGVNGISGLNAAVAGAWFTYLGLTRDIDAVAVLGLAVAGAALGFLPWNAPRAQVFLGDVGSYGLGFTLGVLALLTWASGVRFLLALAPLSVYLADTAWALGRRILGRRPWHEAHREHVYQQLRDSGWSHLASGAWPAAFGAATCFLAWALHSSFVLVAVLLVVLAGYLASPTIAARRKEEVEVRSQ